MTRRCDGTDVNLVMFIDPATGARVDLTHRDPDSGLPRTDKACDCGLVFDDVTRSTIYPHRKF